MAEYIDKSALYEKIAQLEELARNRYLETPSNSPCYSRYMAQLNERTAFKHIIADFHSADVAPVVPGRWLHTEIEDDEEWGGTWHKWTCDNCGYSVGHNPNGTNYCPHCGAKMDGGNEDG